MNRLERVYRSLGWAWRGLRLPGRHWQRLAAVLLPPSLWMRSPRVARCLGVEVRHADGRLQMRVPPGDLLFAPEPLPADDRDSTHTLWELLAHWLYVTVLDNYDATPFLSPGATVVDIGANVGCFTLLASRLVGPEGRVIAVEPIPGNIESLAKCIEENGLANVDIAPVALGDTNGTLSLDLGHATGKHSAALHRTGRTLTVPQRTLDSLVAEMSVGELGFIKIDVEGFEPQVLEGARGAIRQFRPVIAGAAYHLPEHRELLPRLIHESAEGYETRVGWTVVPRDLVCWGIPTELRRGRGRR